MDEPVLVVAAHPDDEVLGAGATMARLSAEGRPVSVLVLGEGVTSRGAAEDGADEALTVLRSESETAAAVLGVREIVHSRLPDNRFDGVDLLDIVQVIEARISEVQPTLVLCQSGADVNVDHQRTHQAILAATRPQPGSSIRSVLAFEVASSTEWAFGRNGGFNPTVFYDVSEHVEAKIEALAAYQSELREWPHPRSLRHVEHQLRTRGAAVGVAAAEAFEIVREVR